MIRINQSPKENHILLDANNTVISITSDNGSGFYFRALIYINDVLFDEQGWSRKDDFTAEKDLKKLYNAYYEFIFKDVLSNGLEQQTHLIKKVFITIEERSIGDDSLIQSRNIPIFNFMYNTKPLPFDNEKKIQFLGVSSEILQVPKNGKISIPFMINARNEALSVTLKNNFGNSIDSRSKLEFTGKRVYLYNYDLSNAILAKSILYLTIEITVGTTVMTKTIRLFLSPKYSIKEIAFLNIFGYWQYAYLDGQMSIDNNLDVKTYEELDNTEKIYEINEKQNYTINTGALLNSEKNIINEICTAIAAKINLNNKFISMVNATKKISLFKDKNNLYSENLTFSVKQDKAVNNDFNRSLAVYSNKYSNKYKKHL